jgi:peptide/nickel transport system permease protein
VELRVYLIRRIILLFFVLSGVMLLVFWIAFMLPEDPAVIWLSGGTNIITEEQLEAVRRTYHLNEPWYMQYLWYLGRTLRGDLGTSPVRYLPVAMELGSYLPQSIELGAFALVLAVALGIPLGIISATRRNTPLDHSSRLWALSVVSLPAFWIGLVFQLVFYYYLGWFADPGGAVSQELLFKHPLQLMTGFNTLDALITGNWPVFTNLLQHMMMPGLILSFPPTARIMRITRSSMLEVMSQDYVRTARACGLPERIVIYRMALKNAMIPTTTTVGLAVGWLLTGSVVVESIFYWPGIGRYAVEAIQSLDFPSLMGYVVVASLMYAIANLAVDVLYAFLDPRIRQG